MSQPPTPAAWLRAALAGSRRRGRGREPGSGAGIGLIPVGAVHLVGAVIAGRRLEPI